MRRVFATWFSLLSCACFFTICSCKSGFILTSPKVLDAGSTEHLTLALFDVPANGTALLSIRSKKNDEIFAQRLVVTSNGYKRIAMEIPPIKDSEAWLQINGTFLDVKETSLKKLIRIRHKSVITFVQTDKPIYKPGQIVRFRFLTLDSQLKPFKKDTVGDVWIEDPGSVRISQWRNVKFSLGITELELPLSEEPVLGKWSIKTVIKTDAGNFSYTQNFEVAEYVLPKYEVIIKAPKYILNSLTSAFPVEVCAQYTYGKKVDGVLNVTLEVPKCPPVFTCGVHTQHLLDKTVISGCHTFSVKPDQRFDAYSVHYITGSVSLTVSAQVTENETGVTQNASTSIKLVVTHLEMKFLGVAKGNQFFRPGLPFYETLQILKPDNTLVGFQDVDICYTLRKIGFWKPEVCQRYTTDERGEVSFSIPPSSPAYNEMQLEAKIAGNANYSSNFPRPRETVSLKAWFSSSGSHLQIHPIYGKLPCSRLEQVKIRYTTHNGSTIDFHYQVISAGRIFQHGSYSHTAIFSHDAPKEEIPDFSDARTDTANDNLPPYIGEFNLTFDTRSTLSPVVRLLVFYARPNGEVVSDSREFDITHCFQNKANLAFRFERQYPSTEAEMRLSASPFSLCGVGIVDRSVHIMRPEKQLNKEKVFKLIEGFDLSGSTAPIQTSKNYCPKSEYIFDHHTPFGALDHEFSRQRRSSRYRGNYYVVSYIDRHVDSITAFENAGMVVISNYALETRPCDEQRFHKRKRPGKRPGYSRSRVFHHPGVSTFLEDEPFGIRDDVQLKPSQKVEDKEKLAPKSVAEIRSYFPETWLWELHSTGKNGDVSFKKTLPDTVTEWVGNAICVHPVDGLGISDVTKITAFQPFFMSFTLPYSAIREEVIPVIIKVFNYLTECLPIKLSLEPNEAYAIVRQSRIHKLCVCGGESRTHRFYIRPVTLEHVNITVHAHSLPDDASCGNEPTAKVTARDAVTRTLLIEAEGFPKEEISNIYFCPQQNNGTFSTKVDLLLPPNVVQGSARAYFTVVGDVMGPALNNLEKLVRLPTGCGEQNMILFVPNVFVLDYLTASGKVTQDIESKAVTHMEKGYQRELRYRHDDGSYSAFGKSDRTGSLWLTSFVVRSFSHARRFISIDENDLTHSTQWIIEKQGEDGCFRRVGTVHHAAMKGGLSHGGESLAPLTAYVLIALLEARITNKELVTKAMTCLQSDTNPSTYSLALFAYAAALAKDTKARTYLEQLESLAIKEGNDIYWKYEGGLHRSTAIETGAYAILAMLEAEGSNNISKVLPVVRWITKQRNSNGGFVSTQDTVIALQALAKYASLISQDQVNIEAVVKSDDLLRSFKVEESNRLLTQSVKFSVVPTVVDFTATGEGCALAQFTLRYNVQSSTRSEVFDLNVTTSQNGSNTCKKLTIGICIRYKIPEQTSNMAVVTVKMISGYVPDKASIKKLYEDNVLALKRHDVEGSDIHFYFNQLTNEQKCFRFLIRNEFEVEDVKPATVELYDYYEPELQITKNYEIPTPCVSSTQP